MYHIKCYNSYNRGTKSNYQIFIHVFSKKFFICLHRNIYTIFDRDLRLPRTVAGDLAIKRITVVKYWAINFVSQYGVVVKPHVTISYKIHIEHILLYTRP